MMIKHYFSTARARKMATLETPRAGSWCHVVSPSSDELDYLAQQFHLERDLLEDATDLYEAPRVEVDSGTAYIFTRYCHPEGQEIATEPLLIIYTPGNIVTIMRQPNGVLDSLISGKIEVLTTQKTKLFLHMLQLINNSYRLQLNLIMKKILRFRSQLKNSKLSSIDVIQFIEIEEDLSEFLSALQPQAMVFLKLESGRYMKLYEDDRDIVEDIKLSTDELIELAKSRLKTVMNMRQAYDAIATNNLNNTFKRLTSIAIFLTIPTIIGGLWGMNVRVPFADDPNAFAYVLLIIGTLAAGAIWFFNRKRWL